MKVVPSVNAESLSSAWTSNVAPAALSMLVPATLRMMLPLCQANVPSFSSTRPLSTIRLAPPLTVPPPLRSVVPVPLSSTLPLLSVKFAAPVTVTRPPPVSRPPDCANDATVVVPSSCNVPRVSVRVPESASEAPAFSTRVAGSEKVSAAASTSVEIVAVYGPPASNKTLSPFCGAEPSTQSEGVVQSPVRPFQLMVDIGRAPTLAIQCVQGRGAPRPWPMSAIRSLTVVMGARPVWRRRAVSTAFFSTPDDVRQDLRIKGKPADGNFGVVGGSRRAPRADFTE
jgi:hypothetical protein